MAELLNYLSVAHVLLTFVHYLIAFCNQPEAASGVISDRFVGLTVPDEYVKFRDPCLNCSGENRTKAVGCGILGHFLSEAQMHFFA